jgi:adenosylhomocysteine nucleosidase
VTEARRRVLVITAVDYEFNAVVGLLRSVHSSIRAGRQVAEGQYNKLPVVVIRAGWGKAQAAAAASLGIQSFSPTVIVMAGIGGGVGASPVITSGDVVIAESTFQYDLGELAAQNLEIWPPETPLEKPYPSTNFESAPDLVRLAWHSAWRAVFQPWVLPAGCSCEKDGTIKPGCQMPAIHVDRSKPRVCTGVIGSGDAFLVDPIIADRLNRNRHVVAVDMETAAVAEEAANNEVPFVAVRVISDVVNGENEDLYYCLKPFAGPRLTEVMEMILLGLESGSDATTGRPEPCQVEIHLAPTAERRHSIRIR